jgi:hypothetical protein
MRHASLIRRPSRPGRTVSELTSRYLPAGRAKRASGPAHPHPATQLEFSTDLPGFEFLVNSEEVLSANALTLPGTVPSPAMDSWRLPAFG